MADKARIGVIGTGWWATQAHLPALKKNADADLVAIADLRPDVLAKAAAAYEVDKTYTDYIEMIDQEKLDGVIIPVHHVAHYEIARTCLEHNLHIMLEKPMVLQATHARELTELAHERQRQLIVGYPWHYTPHTLRARQVLHSGDLGQIRFINSVFASMVIKFYRGDDSSYGSVFDYPVVGPGDVYSDPVRSGGGQGHLQVTHSAALMFFITGLKPLQVSALMDNMDVKVDVIDAMTVRMDNGALATVGSTGTIASGGTDQLQTRVFCDKGWIDLDSLQGTLRICHADGSIEEVTPLQSEQIYPMHMTSVNLVQVIRGEAENGSPPEVGWRTVEMLDAAYRSVQQGGQLIEVASLY
jgi:predicted dehydrogenase